MYLSKYFTSLSAEIIQGSLMKHNVVVPEYFEFSKLNIVIGANGSGKTRFLRALKELYALDNQKSVLYGYFPALSDRKQQTNESNSEPPESTLFESMYKDSVAFSDFFKEIEAHNEEFIPELLAFRSQSRDNALHKVKECFLELTGKQLIIQDKTTYILLSDESLQPLSQALALLSPGELMLFYMSIFLTIQENGKKNKVIILDEPESHLHPKALLSFIRRLTETEDFSEIWIATHSLYLIPEYRFENIIFMSDSSIQKRTSTVYQNLFSSLLGDPEGKVRAFFSSLSQWQYCEFMSECFSNPTVIDTVNPQDEQVQLFIQYLLKYHPLRVLDCGGGSGRLGLSLAAAQIGPAGNVSYDIYDINPTYSGSTFGVIKDLKDAKGPYHCVVMMNFLHEVAPNEWKALFSDLFTLMEVGSYLVFVEVSALSQGEMPNELGYFILSKEELEILFRCTQGLIEIRTKDKQKSSCILVPRSSLSKVTQASIHKAILHLRDRTLAEIKQLRQSINENPKQKTTNKARHYAFLSQQYLNAKLYIDSSAGAKDQELRKSFLEATSILSTVMTLIDPSHPLSRSWKYEALYEKIKTVADYRSKQQKVPSSLLTECWQQILLLEKSHVEKSSIAAFLLVLALMGDNRSINRLNNNGYVEHLPKELASHVRKIYKGK